MIFAADNITQLDACPRGEIGWTSNITTTDNDGDGCRDSDEDLDDDNDGVNDAADVFPKDACASVDKDNDRLPDRLVADCETALAEDLDDDNDGFPDEVNATTPADVDDDNNGLIEIRTLDDLARLRVDLNGDGTDDGNITGITAVGSAGCPAKGCNGYELTRSLNFSDSKSYNKTSVNMDAWTSGSGWQPIGTCFSSTDVRVANEFNGDICTAYTGVFDGQDHTIADLFISVSSGDGGPRGVGFI